LLQRQHKNFSKTHQWQKLHLAVASKRNMPPRAKSKILLERLNSFLAMSGKNWLKLVDPVQRIERTHPPTPTVEPNRLKRVFSLVHSLAGTKKEDNHHIIPATCETATGTGIDCPICSMDLYESVPDDFYKLDEVDMPAPTSAPANSGIRGSVVNFIQTVAINLWTSTPTTTIKNPSATTDVGAQVLTCEDTCKWTEGNWWRLTNQTVVIPPRPIFCPTCRNGFHVTCL
jgi:hypothetical protein